MATLAELTQDNPNISQQLEAWRNGRADAGEAADDWAAFRAHLVEIGAPDPGEEQPEDFAPAS